VVSESRCLKIFCGKVKEKKVLKRGKKYQNRGKSIEIRELVIKLMPNLPLQAKLGIEKIASEKN
jgi:uncharacterized protein (UPF0128 family)